MEIPNSTRSDELVELRKMFAKDGVFAQFGQLFQINLILDANAILADIRWLACKAKNPSARTKLIEAIDAGTIVAYAPTYLEIEVEKNILKIAQEEMVEPEELFSKWEIIKRKIYFIESGGPEEGAIDPKDVPYVRLHEETGFPVLTEDPHISRMGAKVVGIQVSAHAQNYSREAVVEFKIKAGALASFTITSAMVKAASELLRSLGPSLQRIPMWAWLLLIAVFTVALYIDGVSTWLLEKLRNISETSKILGLNLLKVLEPLILEHQESQKNANDAKTSILNEIDA